MEEHLKAFGGENFIAYSFDSVSMRVMTQEAEWKKCLLFCSYFKRLIYEFPYFENAVWLNKFYNIWNLYKIKYLNNGKCIIHSRK